MIDIMMQQIVQRFECSLFSNQMRKSLKSCIFNKNETIDEHIQFPWVLLCVFVEKILFFLYFEVIEIALEIYGRIINSRYCSWGTVKPQTNPHIPCFDIYISFMFYDYFCLFVFLFACVIH